MCCSCDHEAPDDEWMPKDWDLLAAPAPRRTAPAVIDSPEDARLLDAYRAAVEARHTAERAQSVRAVTDATRDLLRRDFAETQRRTVGGWTCAAQVSLALADAGDRLVAAVTRLESEGVRCEVQSASYDALTLNLWTRPEPTPAQRDALRLLTEDSQARGAYDAPHMACTDGSDDDA